MDQKSVRRIFWYHHKIAERLLHRNAASPWTWCQRLLKSFKVDDTPSQKEFSQFYLNSTKDFCTRFLSVNVLLLLVSVYIIAQKHFGALHGELDPTFDAFQPAMVELLIWIVLSGLCLGFFLVLQFRPSLFNDLLMADECDVWQEIGAAVLFGRCLILVTQLTLMLTSGNKCFDAPDLTGTGDNTFGYMFIKMCIDAYQTFTFAALPFPQPWAVVFVLMEMIKQEIRLFTCADRITTDPHLYPIIQLIAYLIVNTYVMLIIMPSIYLEGSYRNRFKSMQLQREAEVAKQEMVEFLSSDVRVPLQYMLHAMDTIDLVSISGSDVHPLLADIHKYSHIVNDIADDLLLLVRIKEKRYTSKMVLVPNLQQLFNDISQSVLERRKRQVGETGEDQAPAHACLVHAAAPAVGVYVNQECLLAALRHLLIFITHNKDKELSGDQSYDARLNRPVEVEISAKTEALSGKEVNASSDSVLKVSVSGHSVDQRTWSEERKVHEATTIYVCYAIAAACEGSFRTRGAKYELIMPCLQKSAAAPDHKDEPAAIVDAPDAPVNPQEAAGAVAPAQEDEVESAGNSVATNLRSGDTLNRKVSPMTLRSDNLELEAKIKLSADMQARFKKNRVCVIIEDTVLEDVITGAIKRMRLDEGMAVLHELQKGSMPIARLTFVTSYKLCQELRARRYKGLIVLFSGSMSYLDDAQKASLDYCLQLPCTDVHLSAFIDWLVSIYEEENRQLAANATAPVPAVSSPTHRQRRLSQSQKASSRASVNQRRMSRISVSAPAQPAQPATSSVVNLQAWDDAMNRSVQFGPVPIVFRLYQCVRSIYRACSVQGENGKDTWFMVPALPEGTFESYMKWKLLNPANSWYHHSTEIFFTLGSRLVMALFAETLLMQQSLSSVIPASIAALSGMIRGCIYKYFLKRHNVPLYAYWFVPTTITAGYYVVSILANGIAPPPEERNMSLAAFADFTFEDNRTGFEYLYAQILTGTHARLYAIYFAQPINLVVLFLILLRTSQAIWQVMRTFNTVQICSFLQLVYIQLTVLNVLYLTHLETSYRNEFMVAHQHILDKAFLDQCLDICQQDVRKPLEYLLARQDDLMKVIMRAGYMRSVHLNRALVSKLEPLHVSNLLFTEMVSEFAYDHQALASDEVALPRSTMELVQLNRSVAKIIAGFSSYSENFHIKIHSEIDNKLAVVRVDWRVLSMVLTNLLNTALKNVRDYCIETPRNKDLTNHILLKFTAVELDIDAKVPFVHPRLMLINVCDSSNAAAKAAKASVVAASRASSSAENGAASKEQSDRVSFKYGNSVCEKLVHKLSLKPIFETVAAESHFKTVQRFTFNYHLTPQTRKAQEFVDAEADKSFLTVRVEPVAYLSAYERILQPRVRTKASKTAPPPQHRHPSAKQMVYLSGVEPEQRKETIQLAKRLESYGWSCAVKYILKVPSMHSVASADCVLIDQQLELSHNVNICDTVLKLRVCGFNGLVVVLLQEGARLTDVIKDELSRSAADIDALIYAPLTDQDIQALTVALEKKCIKQLLYMNGN